MTTGELPRLMICGHGQHGKDSFADALVESSNGLFSKWSSSLCAVEEALLPYLDKYFDQRKANDYRFTWQNQGREAVIQKMYNERSGYRDIWKRAIRDFNTPDPTRLMRKLYEKCNIYVGIRSKEEFDAGKAENAFDFSIWVEDPSKPEETSNEIRREDCLFYVENDSSVSTIEHLKYQASLFAQFLNPEYRRPQSDV